MSAGASPVEDPSVHPASAPSAAATATRREPRPFVPTPSLRMEPAYQGRPPAESASARAGGGRPPGTRSLTAAPDGGKHPPLHPTPSSSRPRTLAFHVSDTGSNPVGVAITC